MSSQSAWTHEDIHDLTGQTIIVTGANSGIGYEATLHLASKGADVILASRNEEKATRAIAKIQKRFPEAKTSFIQLDLADLASVQNFADTFLANHDRLDVLINNAGIMAIPKRKTADGFEMQFGTNHLGHYALTGLLIHRLIETEHSRVVNVSSVAHRTGKIRFDDLHGDRKYNPWRAYGQSKLANLLFTYELDHRLRQLHADTIVVACHPGYSSTNLLTAGPQMNNSSLMAKMNTLSTQVLAQSAYMGALPTLYAATADDVAGGDYIGPDGLMEMRGYPKKVKSNAASQNVEHGRKLWEVSSQLTGIHYDVLSREAEFDA